MNTDFTPGPWKVNGNIGRKGELGILADSAPCIIAVMGNAKEWPVQADANARLIAAAPALYAACNDALSAFRLIRDAHAELWDATVNPEICNTWDDLRAALALVESEDA